MESERGDEVRDELEKLSSGLPGKRINATPPGYFDALPDRIINRWSDEQSKPASKRLSWNQVIGIAAVMAGITFGSWLIFNSPEDQVLEPITAAEAYQYINENIQEFESLIEPQAEYIPEEIEIPTDDIEEYLIEELQDADPEELF